MAAMYISYVCHSGWIWAKTGIVKHTAIYNASNYNVLLSDFSFPCPYFFIRIINAYHDNDKNIELTFLHFCPYSCHVEDFTWDRIERILRLKNVLPAKRKWDQTNHFQRIISDLGFCYKSSPYPS